MHPVTMLTAIIFTLSIIVDWLKNKKEIQIIDDLSSGENNISSFQNAHNDSTWSNKLIFAVLIIWGVLAIIFAFADLQISIAVTNKKSNFAIFLANFGEHPGGFILVLAVLFNPSTFINKRSKFINLLSIFIIMVSSLLIFVVFYTWIPILKLRVILLIVVFIFQWLISLRKLNISRHILFFSKVTIGMAFFTLLFVDIGKDLWGRVRFSYLDSTYSQYSPWYLPQGFSNVRGHDSFPSGHTAMGWLFLPIIILFIKRNRILKICVTILAISFGVLVAISRVIRGVHYASDVLFSSAVALTTFLLFYQYYNLRILKDKY